jgi:hypothetical protein
MNDTRSGSAPSDDAGTWTSETLPLHVRKELLERELRKLGFRKAGAHDGASAHSQQQQQPQESSSHPSAGSPGGHGD